MHHPAALSSAPPAEFPNPDEGSRFDILKIHSRKMNLQVGGAGSWVRLGLGLGWAVFLCRRRRRCLWLVLS